MERGYEVDLADFTDPQRGASSGNAVSVRHMPEKNRFILYCRRCKTISIRFASMTCHPLLTTPKL
jgi:hypothetical protein